MKDRYLFRGKRIDNGEWVQGSVLVRGLNTYILHSVHVNPFTYSETDEIVKTYGDTICQCTGLQDKNGNLIWENDIINNKYGDAIVIWNMSEWQIKWVEDAVWRKDLHYWAAVDYLKVEVIGNKFDNLELIKRRQQHE